MLVDIIFRTSKSLLECDLLVQITVALDYLSTDIRETLLFMGLDDMFHLIHYLVVHDRLEPLKFNIILCHRRNRLRGL